MAADGGSQIFFAAQSSAPTLAMLHESASGGRMACMALWKKSLS